ncbi:MAG: TerC family protein [Planctomycetota bacterium]
MQIHIGWWFGFVVLVIVALSFDLFILQRRVHVVSAKESLLWTLLWVGLALLFNGVIYFYIGSQKGLEFFTGFIIEKSLSLDNLFVFLVIFSYFKVAPEYQPRVLRWGIIGAVITRAIFIALGVALISLFHWILYVFGVVLIITAIKLIYQKETEVHPEKNIILKAFKRLVPITNEYHQEHFFTRIGGKLVGTPLIVVLVIIESTDILFAVDSVPAILGITTDPFIVYTSNIFAILGMRALYFFLAAIMLKLHYLKYGLSFILGFIGLKMLLVDFIHIPIHISLGIICLTLIICVLASILIKPKNT